MDTTLFQYCQKIILFSKDETQILLAKRKGEQDFNATYSFIGGKMETTDKTIIQGLKREKQEEIGTNCQIKIYPEFSINIEYQKKSGQMMILPHILAIYQTGKIELNEEEYSEYKWIKIENLDQFEPKIANIPEIVKKLQKYKQLLKTENSHTI